MEKLDVFAAIIKRAESTITPENCNKGVTPEISIENDIVLITSPRNETLRLIVRSLGYRFSDGAWQMKGNEFNGAAADRAAEAGNMLLNQGFAVIIQDPDIRRKAIFAEYKPRKTKWIKLRTTGTYAGWLSIQWEGKDQDIYNAARKIHGSMWSSPDIVVPIESHIELLDFANIMGFSISTIAKKMIDEYKARLCTPVKPIKPVKDNQPDKLKEILNSSTEILPDLRD